MSYRGNTYLQSETSLMEVREGDIMGKYRGSEWRYKLPNHIPQLRPKVYLKYRGVAYSSCVNAQPYFIPQQEVKRDSNTPVLSQVTEKNLEQVHIANMRRNLERRMEIAQINENYKLLAMLKKESDELVNS